MRPTAATALAVAGLLGAALSDVAGSSAASAQELQLVGPFREVLADRAPVSGRVLVGIRLGSASGPFQPSDLRLGAQPSDGASLCVRVVTRDGRYYALNGYTVASRSGPGTIPYRTRLLDGYDAADVAVRVVETNDCHDDAEGRLLPTSTSRTPQDRELTVLLNPGRARASARLTADPRDDVTCDPPGEGPRTAFGAVCKLPVPDGAEAATLTVTLRGATGPARPLPYVVALGR